MSRLHNCGAGALTVVLVAFASHSDASMYDRRCKTQHDLLKTLTVVIESYRSENGTYPDTLDDARIGALLDAWRRPYSYRVAEDRRSYTLRSRGPDGREGTSDDVFNTSRGIVGACYGVAPEPAPPAVEPRQRNGGGVPTALVLCVVAAATVFGVYCESQS